MKIYSVPILIIFLCASSFSESQEATIGKAATNSTKVEGSCINTQTPESISTQSYLPKDGYVPNEETAIKIAVAVWEPIYGKKEIANEKPYKVNLQNGVWYVKGSVKSGWKGGVAEIEICKQTAQVIRLNHGK
jgi:hypothetical protein